MMSGKTKFTGKKATSSKSLLAPKQSKSGKKTTGRWKETEEERLAREGDNIYFDSNRMY